MGKSFFDAAKAQIRAYFSSTTQTIWKRADLSKVVDEKRTHWGLAKSMNSAVFIKKLLDNNIVKEFDFPFPYRNEKRYALPRVPMLEVLLSVKPDSYYTHTTALVVHGLVPSPPEIIFINHEQRPHHRNELGEQSRIDAAFRGKPRISNNLIEFDGKRICMVNGMNTAQLGVISTDSAFLKPSASIRVTNLERTLIDIVVRPIYAGGVAEVLKAFQSARDRVNIENMVATLQRLNYVYPYHQAIGWYMEKAGYMTTDLAKVAAIPHTCKFYAAHQLEKPILNDRWQLYVPAELA